MQKHRYSNCKLRTFFIFSHGLANLVGTYYDPMVNSIVDVKIY